MTVDRKSVGLFVTCLVDLFRPSIAHAAVQLIEDAGYHVFVPQSQSCCGQLAYNSGDGESAAAIARLTITAFESGDYVVAPSGSCAAMIRHHYPRLLEKDPVWHERAVTLSKRVYELTEFLQDVAESRLPSRPFGRSVTYHDSCSGRRELGVAAQPRALLSETAGVSVTEMQDADVCCGFGGAFCVKYPDLSDKMVEKKARNIAQSGAEVVLGGDLGCLMNIAGKLSRSGKDIDVYHVAEVLAGMTDAPAIGRATTKGRLNR